MYTQLSVAEATLAILQFTCFLTGPFLPDVDFPPCVFFTLNPSLIQSVFESQNYHQHLNQSFATIGYFDLVSSEIGGQADEKFSTILN